MTAEGGTGITLLPLSALADAHDARLEARPRRAGTLVGGILASLIAVASAGGPFIAFSPESPPWPLLLIGTWIALFAMLFAWYLLHHSRSAAAPHGWVLRDEGSRLMINLRSHLNSHFDPSTPSVLVLPRQSIQQIQPVYEKGLRTHVDSGHVHENRIRREFLEITIAGDAEQVMQALSAERDQRGKAWLGSSRFRHSAVSMPSAGVLRVAWRDESMRLKPDLAEACQSLSVSYPVVTRQEKAQAPLETLDVKATEMRLLEMVARGQRLEAVSLAKVLYDLDTTEAVNFVEGLER